jgi:mRNA-degrading endonuclease RelE of RelBE toxin-antitoxin system
MNYNIIPTNRFEKELKRLSKKYPSLKNEFIQLMQGLKENPFEGTPLGMDCFKIRISIASKGKGKSGGARIITHVKIVNKSVFLISIYDKSEQANIDDRLIKDLIKKL